MTKKMINSLLCSVIAVTMLFSCVVFAEQASPLIISKAEALGFSTERIKTDYKRQLTREAFAELMVKFYESVTGKPIKVVSMPFKDTTNTEIAKSYSANIVNGVSNDRFNPDALISKQEIAKIVFNVINSLNPGKDMSCKKNSYTDSSGIQPWAEDAIMFLASRGVIYPDSSNRILPGSLFTGEQAIELIYKAYDSGNDLFPRVMAQTGEIILEAENATLSNVSVFSSLTSIEGIDISRFSGKGVVGTFTGANSKIVFDFENTKAGYYMLKANYATFGSNSKNILTINTERYGDFFTFKSSTTLKKADIGLVYLGKGSSTIEIQKSDGWFVLDNITLVPYSGAELVSNSLTLQAESELFYKTSGVSKVSGLYLSFDNKSHITTIVNASGGKYNATIRAKCISGSVKPSITINGKSTAFELDNGDNDGFQIISLSSLAFIEGSNIVTVSGNGFIIDYITISDANTVSN